MFSIRLSTSVTRMRCRHASSGNIAATPLDSSVRTTSAVMVLSITKAIPALISASNFSSSVSIKLQLTVGVAMNVVAVQCQQLCSSVALALLVLVAALSTKCKQPQRIL
jgi:hypothetical protein